MLAEAFLQLPPDQRVNTRRTTGRRNPWPAGWLRTRYSGQGLYLRQASGVVYRWVTASKSQCSSEHHIGIAGQALQGQALGLQLGAGRMPCQRLAQAAPNQRQVVLWVLAQLPFDLISDLFAQVDKPAVEILPAFQLIASEDRRSYYILLSE